MDSNRISRNELLFCEALTQKCTVGNESLNFASPGELNRLFQRRKKKGKIWKQAIFHCLSFNLYLIRTIFYFVLACKRPKFYGMNSTWMHLCIYVSICILCPSFCLSWELRIMWWCCMNNISFDEVTPRTLFVPIWPLCNSFIVFKVAKKICAISQVKKNKIK